MPMRAQRRHPKFPLLIRIQRRLRGGGGYLMDFPPDNEGNLQGPPFDTGTLRLRAH